MPKTKELKAAYAELESTRVSTQRLALYSQWARLDARLAELLTGFLIREGMNIAIGTMLHELSSLPWPRALLVPLRFAELTENPRLNQIALHALIASIEEAFPEKSNDLFFIPLQRPNRVLLNDDLEFQSVPYLRSGFIGSASLLAKGREPEGATTLKLSARRRILDSLIRRIPSGQSFSVDDYLAACKGRVTRRQAQRDLEGCNLIRASGHTRNLRYQRVGKFAK